MPEAHTNHVQRSVYTAEEIAEILGVSVRKAYEICEYFERTKECKVIRLGKRCVRIHKQSFDNWLMATNDCSPDIQRKEQ